MQVAYYFNVLLILVSSSCGAQSTPNSNKMRGDERSIPAKISKTDAEWKALLSKEEYYILRQAGTERAFSGDLWDHHEAGTYICAACGLELFDSQAKFDSGTGWPSYYKAIGKTHVQEKADNSFGWNRTEVLCARCGGHLGHVFDDGPEPTGLRYCINSASLDFVPKDKMKKP